MQRLMLQLRQAQQIQRQQSRMFVFGLGNPGPKYKNTKHNVGFLTLEKIAALKGVKLRKRCFSNYKWASFDSCTLVQPLTFMNNSGDVIPFLIKNHEALVVISDQMDLPCGKIRIKKHGGSAGHNGLKSIISYYGEDFVHVYIGIGRPCEGVSVVDHVLAGFSEEDRKLVDSATDEAAKAIIDIIDGEDIDRVIQRANSI